ncbi:MAG TPA: alpha/beta hydrolase-fold protein [Chitinophagaceae bacterium]|nr:alpha/beta hydrolase-fold protein [Chitinophagaceae bacterium]
MILYKAGEGFFLNLGKLAFFATIALSFIFQNDFIYFWLHMHTENARLVAAETHILYSALLKRNVTLSMYFPAADHFERKMDLLLINDGQDLVTMNFENILSGLYSSNSIKPVFCVGIGCGPDRKNEYGTAHIPDFKGRGTKSALYQKFIFTELLPFVYNNYRHLSFAEKSFCGFSLGGLSALDTVWNHPTEFKNAGVFSGSLWWRKVSHHHPLFDETKDRIMHNRIRTGRYYPWLRFFFETGTLDETEDRNNNGIIDSIDDTMALIEELVQKGYDPRRDIFYLELKEGRHDVPTWGKAFPFFLKWCWGN